MPQGASAWRWRRGVGGISPAALRGVPSRTTACSRRPPASATLRLPGAAEAQRWAAAAAREAKIMERAGERREHPARQGGRYAHQDRQCPRCAQACQGAR
jgi:hypothetical protein